MTSHAPSRAVASLAYDLHEPRGPRGGRGEPIGTVPDKDAAARYVKAAGREVMVRACRVCRGYPLDGVTAEGALVKHPENEA